MGLFNFDLLFVISIFCNDFNALTYDSIKRRYDILHKRNKGIEKIKPILDYSLFALIIFKIIY